MVMKFTSLSLWVHRLLIFNIETSAKWITLQAQLQYNSKDKFIWRKNKNTNFEFKKCTEITENNSS